MLSDVRGYYGFTKDFSQAGYFETEQSQQIVRELWPPGPSGSPQAQLTRRGICLTRIVPHQV